MIDPNDEVHTAPWLKQALRWAALALVVLAFAGCSVLQALYSQAPRYVQWRTNVAHHFTQAQAEQTQESIRRWFDWQRREQMPIVATLLHQAASDVLGPISPALACERRDAYLVQAKAAISVATPLIASVIVGFGPQQIKRVQSFFMDANEGYRDAYLSADPREQARLAVRFIEKWGALVYGDFTPAQRDRLAADVRALPFDARTVLLEFQRFQAGYVHLLKAAHNHGMTEEQVGEQLSALLLDAIDPHEPARHAQMRRWVSAGCALASELQANTTPSQRERAARTLAGWRADVLEIASSH